MKRVRNALIVATLAALFTLPFIGPAITSTVANAQPQQGKTAKVSYTPVSGGDYNIDPAHSIIGFAIRHLEINWVEGRFKDFTGVIHFDDLDITRSAVQFTAKAESIDTGVEPRNKHLRTADFFDVERYPELTFKSTSVERKGKDRYILNGDFTLKGVTKQVAIPFTVTGAITDPWGNTRFGIDAQTKIDRRDYGVTWGKPMANGGLDVGNEVTINLQLEAVKPAPKPAAK